MMRPWFALEGPRRMALLRIGLGLVLWYDVALHWPYAIELYSTWGPPMPIFTQRTESSAQDRESPTDLASIDPEPPRSQFHLPVPGPLTAVALHSALLCALAGVIVGWNTRISLGVAFVLLAWLGPLDLATTFAKHTVIALHLLALLALSNSGGAWSLDAWENPERGLSCPLAPAWPRRLIEVLVCAIYAGAALTKLKTPAYLSGELVTFSLLDEHWGGGATGRLLAQSPLIVLWLSRAALLFELVFPLLALSKKLPGWLVILAVAFHLSLGALLHLKTFSPIMIVALVAFLRETDLDRLRLPACSTRTPAPGQSPARRKAVTIAVWCFGVTALFGAIAAQYIADWYGAFGRVPIAELARFREVPEQELSAMRAGFLPGYDEYVFRVTLGDRLHGARVAGERHALRKGSRLYVGVHYIRPHPRFALEGLLIAPDGTEAARFDHRVEPHVAQTLDGFELTEDLPSGTFRLVLQVEGIPFAEYPCALFD